MTDFQDYQVPQAHATAISKTGVGLLKFANGLASGTGTTIAGGVKTALASNLAITQPSWEFGASLSLPAGVGTIPFARWSFDWFDPTGLIAVASDNVEIALGNGPANAINITGRGPCKGAVLTVSLQNRDPAQTLTVTYNAYEASHTFERTQFEQLGPPATGPIGFTYAGTDPGVRWAAYSKPSIAASTSVTRLLPVAFGKWRWTVDNTGQSQAVGVQIQNAYATVIPASANIYDASTAAGAVTTFEVSMPAQPMQLIMTNAATTGTITPTLTAVFEPY